VIRESEARVAEVLYEQSIFSCIEYRDFGHPADGCVATESSEPLQQTAELDPRNAL